MAPTPFLGEVKLFPFSYAPKGWALCSGQLMQIAQYQALFALLGTTYGGDGRQTFGVPDLRGRTPLHFGSANGQNYPLGQLYGSETVQLLVTNMPGHSHTATAVTTSGDQPIATGGLPAAVGASGSNPTVNIYSNTSTNVVLADDTIGPAGAGTPHDNMQPYLVLNPCIALVGIFPSRN